MNKEREQMNVVIVGHVDHGKSTLIGRLLADTGALPEGKLEQVQENCRRNAKPFEYAFLLDALHDERSQGITIDSARCFFKSKKRDYIIIDAPGHIEFLKNMVSGAARAEAAILVIDAKEGIRENSKRHGYMMSFLGIKNVTVCINKMDLVDYDEWVFKTIREEYEKFLKDINLKPMNFIPISAREGDNIAESSSRMPWYSGETILQALDNFAKAAPDYARDFRMPVQDVYKFTNMGDDRRIVSGRVESGSIKVGDEVVFLPSNKTSRVTSIESFNTPKIEETFAGHSTGVCLDTQIYIRSGELMCRKAQKLPHVSTKFKANIFWMGRQPLVKAKSYKLKLASQQVPVVLKEILGVLDASELSSVGNKKQIERHDVAECVFEALKPVAFDEVTMISETGRFVLVDNFEISGGGIILAPVFEQGSVISRHIEARDKSWDRSEITPTKRSQKYQHKSCFLVITGEAETGKRKLARSLEEGLFRHGKNAYYLGVSNEILDHDIGTTDKTIGRIEHIQRMGELAHVLTDAGLVLITSISQIDQYELEMLKALNRPTKTLVVNVGENQLPKEFIDLNIEKDTVIEKARDQILEFLNPQLILDPEFTI